MKIKQEIERQTPLKGESWIEEYNGILNKAKKRKVELSTALSHCDSEQSDILHHLEMIRCDAIVSSKLMRALKEIRAKRRLIKEELSALNSITMLAKNSSYSNNESYKYKTNIISIVLGGETIE